MRTDDGRLWVVAGRSRSGKTAWTAKRVKSAPRIWAWDPEAQWCDLPGWVKVTSRNGLIEAMQRRGPMKIAYVSGGDLKAEFDFWCGCVMWAGRYVSGLVAIAEELSDVTTPSKAPGNWGILLRRGLKRGIDIFAISQRWAEADKTALGNASGYACFAMRPRDVKYMADATGLAAEELAGLQIEYWPDRRPKTLPFIEVGETGEIRRDAMRFKRAA